jgi:tetratricopeptide (TPR) repeat protein
VAAGGLGEEKSWGETCFLAQGPNQIRLISPRLNEVSSSPPRDLDMLNAANVDKANQNNLLWPPIADAVDTFLKRRASGADAYERIWRLIHVWEATSISLVGAGVSRVRGHPEHDVLFRRCREHLHGRTWNSVTRSFSYYSGALDGSAMARLGILQELGSIESSVSPYLTALKQFLTTDAITLSRLVQCWARICDVPDQAAQASPLQMRAAMRVINEFRNRIAHVPFPYDGLDELADSLEEVTEQLFGIDPKPWQCFPDERWESAMCGSILWRDRVLYGSAHRAYEGSVDGLQFRYPPIQKKTGNAEAWPAEPFAFIDSMLRPYVLTRLRAQSTGVWEFTRFRAEANSVIYHEAPAWLLNVAAPTESEYRTPEAAEEQEEEEQLVASVAPSAPPTGSPTPPSAASEFEQALRFIRNEEYEPAIDYFARLVATRPQYHIGWLRLGHAQRELAMRCRITEPLKAAQLFADSIESLTHAAEHSYPDRKAQALYERSKAYFQKGRFSSSADDFDRAMEDAQAAYQLFPDTPYETWIGYLRSHSPSRAA